MLSAQELAKIEHYMREEHRKDLEALERLKRFLPENAALPLTLRQANPNLKMWPENPWKPPTT